METITWNDFEKLDIRLGTIISAEDFTGARKPAYKLKIDFGNFGIKKSSAQITKHYNLQELVGRQVVAIINFPVKQIANFFSECLVLGIYDEAGDVVLLKPERQLSNGLKIG